MQPQGNPCLRNRGRFSYTRLTGWFPATGSIRLRITYTDRSGVLRSLLAACAEHNWAVLNLSTDERVDGNDFAHLLGDDHRTQQLVTVTLTTAGPGVAGAPGRLAATTGVVEVDRIGDDTE